MTASIHKLHERDLFINVRELKLTKFEEDALIECMLMSEQCFVGKIDGHLACIWGLIPPCVVADRAYLWLCTTDIVEEHPFIFVRHSQIALVEMLKEFPIITGHCHMQSERTIRWIRWLGGTFSEPQGLRVPFQIMRRG